MELDVPGLETLGDLSGKRVLMRADFNVPIDDAGAITDDTRIRAALPTLRAILEKGAGPSCSFTSAARRARSWSPCEWA